MHRKLLIIGTNNSGKTTLARKIGWTLFDGDEVRARFNHWDFSLKGRLLQARVMGTLMANCREDSIASFICPTTETLEEFRVLCPSAKIIWMNTIKEQEYADTAKMYQPPRTYHLQITDFNYDVETIITTLF